ncbi:MAG: YlbF family regulator [Lachnospiraceae bacterium]|nr:YlbF family regulator [Lachnospiraceae bacterium]
MRTTDEIIREFTEKLKQTKEYRLYEIKRDRAREFPGLQEEINAYRTKNYLLQQSGEELFDRIDEFEREYEQFRANPVVEEYLQAELAVCRMLQDIYTQIAEAIDLDIYPDM